MASIHTAQVTKEAPFRVDSVHLACLPAMRRQGWALAGSDNTPSYELWYRACAGCGQPFVASAPPRVQGNA